VVNSEKRIRKLLVDGPKLAASAYVAPGALLFGAVTLGRFSSIWCNAVLRADLNRIIVGHHSNIQDHCMVHLSDELPCIIGNYVTVGHSAILHACTVQDEVLVGMASTILDGARIGKQSIIGAHALVTARTRIPPGSLVLGAPAKVIRPLTLAERRSIKGFAEKYVRMAACYSKLGIQSNFD
jgi:carbonic anhydrase/acetyltransferase-like protein (isoleucine patch superfamily)